MKVRRSLALGLALALLVTPLVVDGQQAGKVSRIGIPRVGILSPLTSAAAADDINAFRQGIRDLGYIDGQDITIETRWTEGRRGASTASGVKELVPTLTRVGVLWNVANPLKTREFKETEAGPRAMGLAIQSLGVRDSEDFEREFNVATRARVGAIVVLQDPLTTGDVKRIARLAAEARLPTMFGLRDSVDAGGLIAYGPSRPALYRRAAVYVDKILKGAKPGDLPVAQPTTFEFVINRKAAKALGLTIPQSLLIRAPEIIH